MRIAGCLVSVMILLHALQGSCMGQLLSLKVCNDMCRRQGTC